jgi:anti-anti-sigma factor
MEIIATTTAGGAELTLTGRLDTVTSTKLQTALTEAIGSSEAVALDFAGVEYVSSAGLRVLLQGQKMAQASEKSMTLKNVSADVMEVFEITGFSGILTIV